MIVPAEFSALGGISIIPTFMFPAANPTKSVERRARGRSATGFQRFCMWRTLVDDCAGRIYLSRGPERQVHFSSVFNGFAFGARHPALRATSLDRVDCYDMNPPSPSAPPPLQRIYEGGVERSETGGLFLWQPGDNIGSGVYLVRARFDKLSDRGTETITKRVVYLK